ncbi:Striatin [Manis pentadactyla]|nr:Striatin [Manis pentadactyla]
MDVQLWNKMERGPLILLFPVKLELGANETCMLNLSVEHDKLPFDFYKNRVCRRRFKLLLKDRRVDSPWEKQREHRNMQH